MATLGNGAAVTIPAGSITASDFSASTGSGNTVVLQTSPTLITPTLGTPSSGVVTNLTGTAKSVGIPIALASMFIDFGGM